jgi:hypothetical protein
MPSDADEIRSLEEEREVLHDELKDACAKITELSYENAQLRALVGQPPALTFQVPGNRIIVERVAARNPVGIVVARGSAVDPMFHIGAKVLCSTYSGLGFDVDGRTYVSVKEDDIMVSVPAGCRVNMEDPMLPLVKA